MLKFFRLMVILSILASLSLSAVSAQEEVIASGFTEPRGMTYDSDGNLWVVEVGNGGRLQAQGPFGPIAVGGTGKLIMVDDDGDLNIVVQNLPGQGPDGSSRGAQAVIVTEESIWLLLGESATSLPLSHSLIELDRENLRIQTHVDLFSIEARENPDGDIISSNPTDFVMSEDGIFYIANAGCNCIQRWSAGNEVEIFAFWDISDNPVPTGIALAPDGSLYVSFLSEFEFIEGSARIEHLSADGDLIESFNGLTALTDVLVTDDGTVYAVQHGVFSNNGWSAGRVIKVSADGVEEVLGGLNRPWGLAVTPDGGLVVSVNSTGKNGAVIAVPMN